MIDPIHIRFNDEYRRTKRNVLFWAATTIVLAIGTLWSDFAVETSWAQNIRLPPALLTTFSWAVMVYMAFDFWHADYRIAIEHSTLAAKIQSNRTEKDSSELSMKARGIINQFDRITIELAHGSQDAKKISEQLGLLRKPLEDVEKLRKEINGFASTVDGRDIKVRKYYYVWPTIALFLAASAIAGFRVLAPLETRQNVAACLGLSHAEQEPTA